MRFATVAAVTVAAVALPHVASADSVLPAYNVTQPAGVSTSSAVAVDPGSHRVYVAGAPSKSVVVLDGLTGTQVATIAVPYTPNSLALDPATHRLFILGGVTTGAKQTNSLSIIDTTTNAITATVPGATFAFGEGLLAVDTLNHHVFAGPLVTNETGQVVTPSGPSSEVGPLAIDHPPNASTS